VEEWAVEEWAVEDRAVVEWAVEEWAVEEWAVEEWAEAVDMVVEEVLVAVPLVVQCKVVMLVLPSGAIKWSHVAQLAALQAWSLSALGVDLLVQRQSTNTSGQDAVNSNG
jgi:ABC-type cobalamin/Fe3+-siderophores transport system ATPase subunit